MFKILLSAVLMASLVGCTSPEEKEAKACRDSTMAYVMAQNFVKQRLKSPGSAKFPYVNDQGVVARYMADEPGCKHYVAGYVDSQNGFGAQIRNRWFVTMEKVQGQSVWKAHDLNFL